MPITKIKQKRGVCNHVYIACSRPAAGPCTLKHQHNGSSYSDLSYSHDLTRMGAAKVSHGGALRIYTYMCTQMGKCRGPGRGPSAQTHAADTRIPQSPKHHWGGGIRPSRAESVASGPDLADPLSCYLHPLHTCSTMQKDVSGLSGYAHAVKEALLVRQRLE